jgi:cell division protein FtsB
MQQQPIRAHVVAYEDAEVIQLRRQVRDQQQFIDHLQETVFRLRAEIRLLEDESDLIPVLGRVR